MEIPAEAPRGFEASRLGGLAWVTLGSLWSLWGTLGPLLAYEGDFGATLGSLRRHFGLLWDHFWHMKVTLEPLWGHFGVIFGV